jgi:type 1 fimbriae regulatory protein FimB/type 1 fimbriae regulatory protein FimE
MRYEGKRAVGRRRPTIEKRTVTPRRPTNAAVRPREFLTPAEVERLIKAATGRGGRHGHRDATMILLAYRHGLRVAELVALRWDMLDFGHGHLHVRRVKNGRPSTHIVRGTELRALRRLRREQAPPSPYLFTTEREGPMSADGFRKLFARRRGGRVPVPGPPAHAAPRLRVQAGARRARHARDPGVAGAQQHPAHHAVHRADHEAVQRFLAAGGLIRIIHQA